MTSSEQEIDDWGLVVRHETDTAVDNFILFYGISGVVSCIACVCLGWVFCGYVSLNNKRLSASLMVTGVIVLLFSCLNGFVVSIFGTNILVSDATDVMQSQCSLAVHISSLCYGLYRYALYLFYLIRVRQFFRGTSHEFSRLKYTAACVGITMVAIGFTAALFLYITPTIVYADHFAICYGSVNHELRQEILIYVSMDVFVSLALTWLFVIKSRALIALDTSNDAPHETDDDTLEDSEPERVPLHRKQELEAQRLSDQQTFFIDANNGTLRIDTIKKLMLRSIYFGMLAMMTTWVHLAFRFTDFVNLSCVETLVSSVCVVVSFDVDTYGWLKTVCWCCMCTKRGHVDRLSHVTHKPSEASGRNGHSEHLMHVVPLHAPAASAPSEYSQQRRPTPYNP